MSRFAPDPGRGTREALEPDHLASTCWILVVILAVPDVQGDVQERCLVAPGTMFPLLVEAYPFDALCVDQEHDLVQVLAVFRVPPHRNVRELQGLMLRRIFHPGDVVPVILGHS